jgi:hypothetical protein
MTLVTVIVLSDNEIKHILYGKEAQVYICRYGRKFEKSEIKPEHTCLMVVCNNACLLSLLCVLHPIST